MRAHRTAIVHLGFLDDGKRIVTAATEGPARIWLMDAAGRLSQESSLPSRAPITAMAAGSGRLCLGNSLGECLMWNLNEKRIEETWQVTRGDPVVALSIAPDGAVAARGRSGNVRLRQPGQKSWVVELPQSNEVSLLTFLRAERGWLLAAARADGTIRLFDPQGHDTLSLFVHSGPLRALSASRDGALLASAADDAVCVWSVAGGARRQLFSSLDHPIRDLGFAPDGRTLFTISTEGLLKSWDLTTESEGPMVRGLPSAVIGVATRSDGPEHALAFANGSMELFAQRGAPPKRFPAQNRKPLTLLRHPVDGPVHGLELDGQSATIWAFGDSPRISFRTPFSGTEADLNLSSGLLALGDLHGHIDLWSPDDREIKSTISTGLGTPVRHLSFSDNGRWVAAESVDNSLGVWSVGNSATRSRVMLPANETVMVRFVGSDRLAVALRGGAVKIWNFALGKLEHTLVGHTGRILTMAISPDLRTLVTGAVTGEVKFWDVRTGQELLGLRRHAGPVLAADFSGDGRYLLTGGADGAGRGELAYWEAAKE
jgi:WD40 repeat protein